MSLRYDAAFYVQVLDKYVATGECAEADVYKRQICWRAGLSCAWIALSPTTENNIYNSKIRLIIGGKDTYLN